MRSAKPGNHLKLDLRAISKYMSPEAYIQRGDLMVGFFALLAWGVYTWKGFLSKVYGILTGISKGKGNLVLSSLSHL